MMTFELSTIVFVVVMYVCVTFGIAFIASGVALLSYYMLRQQRQSR